MTPEIEAAKQRLALQATELPNWARQLLDYIAELERREAALRMAMESVLGTVTAAQQTSGYNEAVMYKLQAIEHIAALYSK